MEAALTLSNFREVAGHQTAGGRSIRRGLLYRSEATISPNEREADALDALGIQLVCDLRSDSEREHAPNEWWRHRDVELLNLDLLGSLPDAEAPWRMLRADPTALGARAAMKTVYGGFPEASGSHLVELIRRIGGGAVPVLIHCTAGKDRTGFVMAVLLSALGIPRSVITADYLNSAGRQSETVEKSTRQLVRTRAGVQVTDQAMSAMLMVHGDYLNESFFEIERRYRDVNNYLRAKGLREDELSGFRNRLLH